MHLSIQCDKLSPVIDMKLKLRGSAMLLLATVIWGSTFVAQSLGMDTVGPFTFQAVRCGLGALSLLPIIWIFDRKKQDGKNFWTRFLDKRLWLGGIFCAIPFFAAANLQQVGIVTTDAGKSAFLTAMYIVFVPVIGTFVKKKPSLMVIPSVILAVAGLYFLSCMGMTGISSGDIVLLLCAVAFAVQILVVDKFAPEVDPLRLNCIQAMLASIGSTVLMLLFETPTVESILESWLPLCYAGVLSMGLAFSLQILGQKHLEPSVASLIMSLEAVIGVTCASIILNETMTQWEILGCCLVFLAIILSQIPVKHKK